MSHGNSVLNVSRVCSLVPGAFFTSPEMLYRNSNRSHPHRLITEQLQTAGGGFSSWESEMLPRKTQKKSQSQPLVNNEFVVYLCSLSVVSVSLGRQNKAPTPE